MLPRTVKIHYPSASGEPLSVSQARSYLECRSVGSWPPATLTWWKKGKFMGKAKEQVSETLSQRGRWLVDSISVKESLPCPA